MDEQSLINSLRDGDARAFGMIFQRFQPPVYAWVLRNVHEADVAKDITQDIFLWLWENRMSLPEILSLKAYLVASARYRVYQLVRKQQRMEKIRQVLRGNSRQPHGADPLDDDHPMARILEAMNSLSSAKRKILQLFYLKGNTAKHISKKMGLNYQYVRNALSLGRSEIRMRVMGRRKI